MRTLEERLGYTFRDRKRLEGALYHSSYANENRGRSCESNERLEFLGDSVLGLVVADALYRRFPDMPEGRMTRMRAQLVCEESLHHVASELGLGEYMRLGRGEEHTGGRSRTSILADAVEALIAAMYLDGGMDVASRFITEHILSALDGGYVASGDSKTELQELVQRRSNQTLQYELVSASGPDHAKVFTSRVLLNGQPIGKGQGHSKKEAEQAAAHAGLTTLIRG